MKYYEYYTNIMKYYTWNIIQNTAHQPSTQAIYTAGYGYVQPSKENQMRQHKLQQNSQ